MMFERALYYPTIDIHNERWLKSAVLFWDRIETIVPESEDTPYRRRSTRELEGEGLLFAHRINPFSEEVRGLEQDVVKFINTKEGKKSFIRPWGRSVASLANRRYGPEDICGDDNGLRMDLMEDKMRDTYRDFYIHVEKLPMMLRETLGIHDNGNGYVWASRGFMSFYMTLLANRICQNNNMSLLTDKVNQNNLSNKILLEGLTPSGRKAKEKKAKRAMMYQVIMDDLKIDPSTPMNKIVLYKKERCHELAQFRAEIDRLTTFDVEGMSAQDLEHEIQTIYVRQVLPAMDAIKATLKDSNINWKTGTLACVFTGLLPAVLGFGADMKTNIAIGASECIGLAITAVPHLIKRIEVNSSPYSYLMKMNQQLSCSWRYS